MKPVSTLLRGLSLVGVLACLVSSAEAATPSDPAAADLSNMSATAGACGQTTQAAQQACRSQAQSDRSLAQGTCANNANPASRNQCLRRADRDYSDAINLCGQQQSARQQLCGVFGQAAYDPRISPADFTNRIDNPYLPLRPGTLFVYRSPHGLVNFEVTGKTKMVLGVKCVVVHDVGYVDGKLEEDTYDYFAQNKTTHDVWYFGEDTAQYKNGVVVGVEGAWLGGVDGAKPGIVMLGVPKIGKTYRQEFLLGTAEDAAEVKSLTDSVTVPYGRFDKSVRTKEFSPLEPDALEDKYYVRGVGQVLTIDRTNGEREALVRIVHR